MPGASPGRHAASSALERHDGKNGRLALLGFLLELGQGNAVVEAGQLGVVLLLAVIAQPDAGQAAWDTIRSSERVICCLDLHLGERGGGPAGAGCYQQPTYDGQEH